MAGYRKRWGWGHLLLGCSRVTAWPRWCLVLKQHLSASLTALITPGQCAGHKGMWTERKRSRAFCVFEWAYVCVCVAPCEPDIVCVYSNNSRLMWWVQASPGTCTPTPQTHNSSVPGVWAWPPPHLQPAWGIGAWQSPTIPLIPKWLTDWLLERELCPAPVEAVT